ncbi:hypothetical protein PABG_07669 [Paracoccidioides brasiliensis Pb03]|nr:hypothetical protein PABG_07669 [Paracoccidioides brasiliensis Pb03]
MYHPSSFSATDLATNSDEDMCSCLSCERPASYKIEPGDVRKSEITLPEPNHGLEQGSFLICSIVRGPELRDRNINEKCSKQD